MGLDMSLYRVTREIELPEYPEVPDGGWGGSSRTEEETKAVDDYFKACEFIYERGEDVAYWRKFNALHGWLVDETQNGVDHCQYSEVEEYQLEELLSMFEESLATKEVAIEPVGGFFFGGTDIDEYYWEEVEDTIEKLQAILKDTDFEQERIVYNASW